MLPLSPPLTPPRTAACLPDVAALTARLWTAQLDQTSTTPQLPPSYATSEDVPQAFLEQFLGPSTIPYATQRLFDKILLEDTYELCEFVLVVIPNRLVANAPLMLI